MDTPPLKPTEMIKSTYRKFKIQLHNIVRIDLFQWLPNMRTFEDMMKELPKYEIHFYEGLEKAEHLLDDTQELFRTLEYFHSECDDSSCYLAACELLRDNVYKIISPVIDMIIIEANDSSTSYRRLVFLQEECLRITAILDRIYPICVVYVDVKRFSSHAGRLKLAKADLDKRLVDGVIRGF
jgi:hypothetical protein